MKGGVGRGGGKEGGRLHLIQVCSVEGLAVCLLVVAGGDGHRLAG